MNRTLILLTEKKQVTSDLFEYKLKLTKTSAQAYDAWGNGNAIITFISIIASNDKQFHIYLKDLQYILVDTDACMAFDDNEILSKIKLA